MTVTIDNIETNYFDLGEKSDYAVVMLHGWASNIELFRPSATLVSSKYRVLAMDLPGHGETPEPPTDWHVDDYADFVSHFLTHFGVKKVIFLGHSYGGRVIIKLASRSDLPFEIDKIILVDSAGVRPEKSKEQMKKEKVMGMGKKLLTHTPGILNKLQGMVGSADYQAASPLMRKVLVNSVNEDLTPLLPEIKQSTLLIWGTRDTATPITDAEKMEALIPDAGLARMEGCGHFSFLDNPALYNAILSSFLHLN
ncbi:MAG: alpha/beta hydrolase [Clostridia bacterium]|nr:alpha/beta hydrolase [Clostridia bacterium]